MDNRKNKRLAEDSFPSDKKIELSQYYLNSFIQKVNSIYKYLKHRFTKKKKYATISYIENVLK